MTALPAATRLRDHGLSASLEALALAASHPLPMRKGAERGEYRRPLRPSLATAPRTAEAIRRAR
jgi:hypothetical protein